MAIVCIPGSIGGWVDPMSAGVCDTLSLGRDRKAGKMLLVTAA